MGLSDCKSIKLILFVACLGSPGGACAHVLTPWPTWYVHKAMCEGHKGFVLMRVDGMWGGCRGHIAFLFCTYMSMVGHLPTLCGGAGGSPGPTFGHMGWREAPNTPGVAAWELCGPHFA